MGKYASGEFTHQLILDTAKELFYEKGYSKTTTRDIARAANVYPTCVAYHFRSKDSLLAEITDQANQVNLKEAACYSDDPALQYFISNYIFYYKFYNNEKYRRFFVDVAANLYQSKDLFRKDMTIWEHAQHYGFAGGEDEKFSALNQSIVVGIAKHLLLYTATALDQFTFTEIANYEIQTYSKIYGLSTQVSELIISKCVGIVKQIDFSKLYIGL